MICIITHIQMQRYEPLKGHMIGIITHMKRYEPLEEEYNRHHYAHEAVRAAAGTHRYAHEAVRAAGVTHDNCFGVFVSTLL